MSDILKRLRILPSVRLPKSEEMIPVAQMIRKMMVERAEAADEIERLRALLKDPAPAPGSLESSAKL